MNKLNWRINKGEWYFHIHIREECDHGKNYDFTIYDSTKKEYDGGVLEELVAPSIAEASLEILADFNIQTDFVEIMTDEEIEAIEQFAESQSGTLLCS
ncbi:LPD16 domain-containing protein [Emergencia sp. 1XD21-10]|uniref:LPD16 domain-containing protein n=1 Tax=Emergencia sp. 1XD21-10 TaxID=2304569 RepID=UPI00137965DD|nr:LPD16 domain-containing protein [Emergencia sp. 1XD21-10]NCE98105.1 hypothetical protein [Emergencia sp. 1XD21-10]